MKTCNNCNLEMKEPRIKADELYFCSKLCLVEFADREKHSIQKSKYYAMCKEDIEIPTPSQVQLKKAVDDFEKVKHLFDKGCGKTVCCKNLKCMCRSFDAEQMLREA